MLVFVLTSITKQSMTTFLICYSVKTFSDPQSSTSSADEIHSFVVCYFCFFDIYDDVDFKVKLY